MLRGMELWAYPGLGSWEQSDQFGQCFQILVETGTKILRESVLLRVIFPEHNFETEQPITSLEQPQLQQEEEEEKKNKAQDKERIALYSLDATRPQWS